MNTKRIVLTALTGLISLASISISLSLAWFAAGANLRVDTLEISIRGERNLTISTSSDIDSFKSKLTKEELNDYGAFYPVSSMFGSRWQNEENPYPAFYEYPFTNFFPSDGVPYGPDKSTSGFFQQTLYLMCDDDAYISLDPDATHIVSDEEQNRENAFEFVKENPEYTIREVLNGMNDLVNAMRFSIYDIGEGKYYIFDTNKEGITYYGGALDNDNDTYYDVYEDDDGNIKEVIYGEVNNRELAVYEDVGDEDIDIGENEKLSSFTAKHKKNTKRFLKQESLSSGLSFAKEEALTLLDVNTYDIHTNKMVLEVEHTVPKPIVLSIYLEGWDLDCINRTMGGSFLSQIQFRILREK